MNLNLRTCQLEKRVGWRLLLCIVVLFLSTSAKISFKFFKGGYPIDDYSIQLLDHSNQPIQSIEYEDSTINCILDYKQIIFFREKRVRHFTVNRKPSNLKTIILNSKKLNIKDFVYNIYEFNPNPLFLVNFSVIFDEKQPFKSEKSRELMMMQTERDFNQFDVSGLDSLGYPKQKLYYLDLRFRMLDAFLRLIIIDNFQDNARSVLLI